MSFNGSGTFNVDSAGQPVVSGSVISSVDFNALTADLAVGLSTAICKDGQTTTTAIIPFASGIQTTSLQADSVVSDTGLGFGTYTPVTASLSNITTSSGTAAMWLRLGNTVIVSYQCSITAASTASASIYMSLPITSDLAGGDCLGSGGSTGGNSVTQITGDPTTNRAVLAFSAGVTTAIIHTGVFMYSVQ